MSDVSNTNVTVLPSVGLCELCGECASLPNADLCSACAAELGVLRVEDFEEVPSDV